jgi:hypothetical protein
MSQELDSGTLTLLILIGYWYWRSSRSTGDRPPADLKVNKTRRSGPGVPVRSRQQARPRHLKMPRGDGRWNPAPRWPKL